MLELHLLGGLHPYAAIHDEVAHLFQARLFASGHLVAPAAPLPGFFDEPHLLVTPVRAAKYPFGHALALAPFVALGLPALWPVLAWGLTGSLTWTLVRRFAPAPVAAWTVGASCVTELALRFRPTFLSHASTAPAWVAALLLVDRRASPWAVVTCVGWVALCRPETGLALAVVVALGARERGRDFVVPAVVGGAGVALLVVAWNVVVTGAPWPPPWALWARQYLPSDAPGFGTRTELPTLGWYPDVVAIAGVHMAWWRAFVPANLPEIWAHRLIGLVDSAVGPFWPLLPAGLWGLRRTPRAWPFVVGWASLFAAHAWFHAPDIWNPYYLEADPVLPFLAAMGAWTVIRALWGDAKVLALVLLVVTAERGHTLAMSITSARFDRLHRSRYLARAQAAADALPPGRHVVFVRYTPYIVTTMTILDNEPDLVAARVWFVRDLGPDEDARLLASAPDRSAWTWDEATDRVSPYTP